MGRRIPGDDKDGAPTDDQLTLIWDEAKKHLRGSLNESAFQFWFDRTLPLGLDDGAFVIGVPNDFAREWIEKRFAAQVAAALGQVLGDAVEVRVVVDERAAELPQQSVVAEAVGEGEPPKPISAPTKKRRCARSCSVPPRWCSMARPWRLRID